MVRSARGTPRLPQHDANRPTRATPRPARRGLPSTDGGGPALPARSHRPRRQGPRWSDRKRDRCTRLGPVVPLGHRNPRPGLPHPADRVEFHARPSHHHPRRPTKPRPTVSRLSGQFSALLARFRSQNSFVSWACRVPACRVRRVGRAVRGCVGRCVRGVRPHVASRGPRRRRRVAFRCRVFRAGVARIWWW